MCSGRHTPQSRAHRATTWSICIVLTLLPLPQISHFTILQQLQKLFFFLSWSTDFHLHEGASPDMGISLLLQHAPLQSPGFVTLLLFSSFFLPSYARIIIVPTGDQSLLLVFSWCFARAVAPVDVFLMHSMSFYFSATLVFHNNVVLFLTSMISSSRIRKRKI